MVPAFWSRSAMLLIVLGLLVFFRGSLGLPDEDLAVPDENNLPQMHYSESGPLNVVNDESGELPSHAVLASYADGTPIPGLAQARLNASQQSSFIFDGRNARKGAHKYIASIQIRQGNQLYHVCGGFLTRDPRAVITAAHCLKYISNFPVVVALGYYQLSLGSTNQGSQLLKPVKFFKLPGYLDGETPLEDLMVLRLERKARINRHVRGIRIRRASPSSIYGKEASFVGWGIVNDNRDADILQEAKMKIFTDEKCRFYWRDGFMSSTQQVCAQGNYQQPCTHDDGSPLVYNKRVVGVASFWQAGCPPDVPTVFQVPFAYMNWIKTKAFIP